MKGKVTILAFVPIIIINDKVVDTLKATTATKQANTGGALKQEDFSYKWTVSTPGSSTLGAKAYDWKGNYAEGDPVPYVE